MRRYGSHHGTHGQGPIYLITEIEGKIGRKEEKILEGEQRGGLPFLCSFYLLACCCSAGIHVPYLLALLFGD